jgi:hypothetical protein
MNCDYNVDCGFLVGLRSYDVAAHGMKKEEDFVGEFFLGLEKEKIDFFVALSCCCLEDEIKEQRTLRYFFCYLGTFF